MVAATGSAEKSEVNKTAKFRLHVLMITASSLLVTFVVVCAGAASGVPAPAAAGAAASRAEAAAETAVPSDAA